MIDILFIASSSASFVSTSLSYISNEHLFSDLLHHWPLFFELFCRANGQLMFFCCECFIVGSRHRPFLSFLNHCIQVALSCLIIIVPVILPAIFIFCTVFYLSKSLYVKVNLWLRGIISDLLSL